MVGGHARGIANEVLRFFRRAARDGTLTMRSTLAFSANWRNAHGCARPPPFPQLTAEALITA